MTAPLPDTPPLKKRVPWLLRHWGLTLVVSLCLLATLAVIYFPTAKAAWKHHQALDHLAKAQSFMADHNWAEAAPFLEKAFIAEKENPEVIRACADYERDAVKNADATGYYLKLLIDMKAANSDDRAVMGQALLAQGKVAKAREMYQSIPEGDRNLQAVAQLESELLRNEGNATKANDILRRSLASDAHLPASRLKLAIMDTDSPLTELQQQSLEVLWELAQSPTPEALRAIERLAFHPLLSVAQSAELLALVSKKENAGNKLRYLVLSSYLRFHASEREAQLDQQTRLITGKSDEQLSEFCQWLLSEKEPERVLKLLPRDQAVKNPKLLPSYMDALLNAQQWKEIAEVVQTSKGIQISPLNVAQLLARSAHGLGEAPAVVRSHLEQGKQYAVASKDNFGLDRLSSIAEQLGYLDLAVASLQSITVTTQQQREQLATRILDYQRRLGDVPGMLATLDAINSSQTHSNEHVEAFIYLKLISGMELETLMEDCALLAARGRISPNAHQFLKALAAYRLGETDGTPAALDAITYTSLPVGWRAVYAGLQGHAGNHALAFQIAEKIPQALLSPEELLIFSEAL